MPGLGGGGGLLSVPVSNRLSNPRSSSPALKLLNVTRISSTVPVPSSEENCVKTSVISAPSPMPSKSVSTLGVPLAAVLPEVIGMSE